MNDALKEADDLFDRAKVARKLGDNQRAVNHLDLAIRILDEELQSTEAEGVDPNPVLLRRRNEVAAKLADAYGQRGGRYREMKKYPKSRESYEQGRKIEQDPRYGIVDSYNLTNALVLAILEDPDSFRAHREAARAAAAVVLEHVRGKRRDQWWAWADLGILSLLIKDLPQAMMAYEQFRSTNARDEDYLSTSKVLRECHDRLTVSEPEVAAGFRDALEYLNRERARLNAPLGP